MNFLSLFSGIGGIDLGLERAGLSCIGQVEIDPFCNQILEKHWPNIPRHTDVSTLWLEDSHARMCHWLAEEPESKEEHAADCGLNFSESFALYDHDTSYWKMSQGCFPWVSDVYSVTWPQSGMMRNGSVYALPISDICTAEKEFSLLPTPTASDVISLRMSLVVNKNACHRPKFNHIHLSYVLADVFSQYPTAAMYECLMGFPMHWTDINL